MSIEHTNDGSVAEGHGDVSISVRENDKILSKLDDELSEGRKYGDCYIFDYQKFKEKHDNRHGSENDAARLKHVFTELNFNVYYDEDYKNLSKRNTLDALKEAAQKDHSQSKYFICCFLTHGNMGKLLMYDKYIEIDDILQCFSRSACETLSEKPKIFIFQTCHGSCREREDPIDLSAFGSFKDDSDYQDFFIVYATYDDPIGHQNNCGSYFIEELCRTLEQFSDELNLLQILTITNYRITYLFEIEETRKETYRNKIQMPSFTSRLRSEVKFNRKILGLQSIEKPIEDKKIYNIPKSKRIKFLSLFNTRGNFEKDLKYCASNLWSSVANKGYQREDLRNWSEKELMDFLEEFKSRDFSSTDCLICFIACKTKGNYLCDVEGNKFLMQKIVEQFTGDKCLRLLEKPKIFIFLLFPPVKKSFWPFWWLCASSESTDIGGDSSGSLIPVHADILEIAITIKETHQLDGVTEKFRKIFGKESSEDFLSQLTRMNAELVRDYGFYSPSNKNLATFCLNSKLTKTLILNNTKCTSN